MQSSILYRLSSTGLPSSELPPHLADPRIVTGLGDLKLLARRVVEGFISGMHKSPFHGFSIEFSEHREYSPGDELRHIDWKVFAKTDRYYVKQYEAETNLRSTILLDTSGSMGFTSGTLTKLHYGSCLAACLTQLLLRQQDATGLVMFDTELRRSLPPRATPNQKKKILEMLANAQPGGETDAGAVLHALAANIKRRGLIIIISDLLDDAQKILQGLKHFQHLRHDIIVFHVLDDAEIDFTFDRRAIFQDMETFEQLKLDPRHVRKRYRQLMGEYMHELENACHTNRIGYCLARTSTPFAELLQTYLRQRARLG
jgi:uncharacterized protein (DUF58 family)